MIDLNTRQRFHSRMEIHSTWSYQKELSLISKNSYKVKSSQRRLAKLDHVQENSYKVGSSPRWLLHSRIKSEKAKNYYKAISLFRRWWLHDSKTCSSWSKIFCIPSWLLKRTTLEPKATFSRSKTSQVLIIDEGFLKRMFYLKLSNNSSWWNISKDTFGTLFFYLQEHLRPPLLAFQVPSTSPYWIPCPL